MELWKPVHLKDETCYLSKIGLMKVWIKRFQQDWYIASEPVPFRDPKDVEEVHYFKAVKEEATREWKRWVVAGDAMEVSLTPLMPDRPVVVRPGLSLRVPKGHEALFYVYIPIWLRVDVGSARKTTLCEIPTTVLSNTWFGDQTSGELCYSLRSWAKRRLEKVPYGWHQAACPVQVSNNSNSELDFQRFCLHVEHLAVYHTSTMLWTNKVQVVFRGEDQASQITISATAPGTGGAAVRISEPRKALQKSIVRKSFNFLRNLTGF